MFKKRRFGTARVVNQKGSKKVKYWVSMVRYRDVDMLLRCSLLSDDKFAAAVFLACSACGTDLNDRYDGCSCGTPTVNGAVIPTDAVALQSVYTFFDNSPDNRATITRFDGPIEYYTNGAFDDFWSWHVQDDYEGILVSNEFSNLMSEIILHRRSPWAAFIPKEEANA